MQTQNDNDITPFTLPIQEPPRRNKKIIIIAISILVVALIAGAGAAAYFLLQPQPASNTAAVGTTREEPKANTKADVIGTAECPIAKDEYVEAAKQVYLYKNDSSLKGTDPKVKQHAAMISQYLATAHPGLSFVLVSGHSFPGEDSTQYRSFELVNGALVELEGLVPQIIVSPTNVTLDLSDNYAGVTTQAQRDAITASKTIPEAKLVSIVNGIINGLTDEEKSQLYAAFKDDDGCIEARYSLVWSQERGGLIYRVALNASSAEIDAASGKVLSEHWHNGIVN